MGLSMAMVLLTTSLTPIIILSSFGNTYKNAKTSMLWYYSWHLQ
jgi:NADH-quinone oxidoreductase subunit M